VDSPEKSLHLVVTMDAANRSAGAASSARKLAPKRSRVSDSESEVRSVAKSPSKRLNKNQSSAIEVAVYTTPAGPSASVATSDDEDQNSKYFATSFEGDPDTPPTTISSRCSSASLAKGKGKAIAPRPARRSTRLSTSRQIVEDSQDEDDDGDVSHVEDEYDQEEDDDDDGDADFEGDNEPVGRSKGKAPKTAGRRKSTAIPQPLSDGDTEDESEFELSDAPDDVEDAEDTEDAEDAEDPFAGAGGFINETINVIATSRQSSSTSRSRPRARASRARASRGPRRTRVRTFHSFLFT
jgi:hypothetical protein